MKLKKRIISAIMAICVSMSILPTNMQLLAVEAKAGETTTLSGEDNAEAKAGETTTSLVEDTITDITDYSKYIPTGEATFYLYYNNLGTDINAIYLINDLNEIVATTVANNENSTVPGSGEHYFYRTRKLNANEKFHLGYKKNDITYVLKNTKITVTDQPYINSINPAIDSSLFYEDNGCIVLVSACNIDFSKLSFTLSKDKKIFASSEGSTAIKYNNDIAYYYVKFEDEQKLEEHVTYDIVYKYPTIEDIPKRHMASSTEFHYTNWYSKIWWNYKTESVEYYNQNMLPNSKVSYAIYSADTNFDNFDDIKVSENVIASGEAITVDANHVIKINLQEALKKAKKKYSSKHLYITNSDGNQIGPIVFDIGTEKVKEISHSSSRFYLSTDTNFELGVSFLSDSISNFPEKCMAYIDENTDKQVEMTNEGSGVYNNYYYGTYNGKLETGVHKCFLNIGERKMSFEFYVVDVNKISISEQHGSGSEVDGTLQQLRLDFPSNRIAEWYCGEGNTKIKNKLKIKVFNLPKRQGEVIGEFDSKDFTISGNNIYRYIQFNSDKAKSFFNNLYLGYIYIYFIDEDGNESELYNVRKPEDSFYENSYNDDVQARYLRYDRSGQVGLTTPKNSISVGSYGRMEIINMEDGDMYVPPEFDEVYGSDTAFPAKVIITDWYSIKPIKTITIPNSGYKFTESDVADLSPEKLYGFFLQGNDGSANHYVGYVKKANNTEDDKEL